jgi:hypothetical protein
VRAEFRTEDIPNASLRIIPYMFSSHYRRAFMSLPDESHTRILLVLYVGLDSSASVVIMRRNAMASGRRVVSSWYVISAYCVNHLKMASLHA